MNNGRKTIIKIQAILFAVLFAAFAFVGCKNNDNNKADENGFTAEQRTVLCDAARAFYLLDFDYNSKDNAISFRQLEEFAFYVYAYGDSLETTAADNSGYRSVDGQKVDDIVKMLFGVKLGTRSSRPGRYGSAHRKRCLRRKNRAYGCKCGQRKQHADNRMQILQSQMSFPRRTAERNLTALPKFYQI